MSKPQDKKLNRRNLLIGGLRYASLGTIGAGGGAAVLKRKRLLRDGKCLNQGVCTQCGVFTECGLPRAISIRAKFSERSDG